MTDREKRVAENRAMYLKAKAEGRNNGYLHLDLMARGIDPDKFLAMFPDEDMRFADFGDLYKKYRARYGRS